MSIFSDVIWLFKKDTDSEPVINKAISLGSIFIQSDASLDKFYRIYKKNQFVRSSVTNLMDTIGKAGFQLLDDNGEAINGSNEQEIRDLDEK